ncbi:hypothetical protein LCGC14_1392330 [marine sediment metagenome]|uniref:Uncharacterized protein n=1 Tax=marine sediment metagenome TaxID=412755 RepID=A0A0F9JZJ0_9ZZZZ
MRIAGTNLGIRGEGRRCSARIDASGWAQGWSRQNNAPMAAKSPLAQAPKVLDNNRKWDDAVEKAHSKGESNSWGNVGLLQKLGLSDVLTTSGVRVTIPKCVANCLSWDCKPFSYKG